VVERGRRSFLVVALFVVVRSVPFVVVVAGALFLVVVALAFFVVVGPVASVGAVPFVVAFAQFFGTQSLCAGPPALTAPVRY
jgi:hypothetical protein